MQTTSRNADSASSTGGLELRIAARGSSALLTLHNGGPDPLQVLSHVDAGYRHYDWFTVLLEGDAETRLLHFYGDRNESVIVTVELAPGGQLEHLIDLAAWAERKINDARPLAAGHYRMSATYEVSESESDGVWNGKIVSPTVSLTIP
jgi:hypothetical protein